jgi:hypothetical protein
MPRLQRPGPTVVCGVVASRPLLAVGTKDSVRLVDPATREELARTDVGLGDDGELAFCTLSGPTGPAERLAIIARGEQATTVTALEVPKLALAGRAIVDGRAQAVYAVRDRLVIGGTIAEVPQVVTLTARGLTVATVAMRGPLHGGATTPEGHLLVVARDQLERWDVVARRVLARFNLPLPFDRVRALGFAARQRLVWFAIGGPVGAIDVYRFSDGRPQGRATLAGAFLGAAIDPDAERLLVAVQEGGAVVLREIDVTTQQPRTFPGGRSEVPVGDDVRAFALVEGEAPVAALVDGEGRLSWEALEPSPLWAAVAAERRAREAQGKRDQQKDPAFKVTRPPKLGGAATGDTAWRERLGSGIPRASTGTGATASTAARTSAREAPEASTPAARATTTTTTATTKAKATPTATGRATATATATSESTGDWRARIGRGPLRGASTSTAAARVEAARPTATATAAGARADERRDDDGAPHGDPRAQAQAEAHDEHEAHDPHDQRGDGDADEPAHEDAVHEAYAEAHESARGDEVQHIADGAHDDERQAAAPHDGHEADGEAARAVAAGRGGFGAARSSPSEWRTSPARAGRTESVRTRLFAEGIALLGGRGGDDDPARHLESGGEGARVIEAFQLDPPARTGLALLYAAWLDGLVEGVSAAQLAEGIARVHADLDEDEAWREALGLGQLGPHGLATMSRGRARLVPAVGRFLDGHPLRLRRVQPPAGTSTTHDAGTLRLECSAEAASDPAALAARAAAALGHDVAWTELDGATRTPRQRDRVVRRALVEAHLGGAVPLFITADPAILELLDGRLAVVACPSGGAPALDRLPRL